MIESKELRVGNWVLYDGKPTKVHEPFIGAFKHLKADPIELTPEILEACGFVNTGSNWYTEKYFTDCKEALELIRIDINANTFRASIENDDNEHEPAYTAKPIKYVHQLQNLYYALTQTELQIKF
jgi:hypothetical protein